MSEPLRAISLFSGAGGMDVGFENAGIKVVFANELVADAAETYRANHPDCIMVNDDINNVIDSLGKYEGIDLVFGGPPCQGFSVAGKMDPDDDRSKLIFTFLDVVERVKPRAFVMENVKALGELSKWKDVRERYLKKAFDLGYSCHYFVLNATDYGVPQKRERIVIVGFKDNVDFSFPNPVPESERTTLKDILEKEVDKKYYVRDAILESRIKRLRDKNYPKPYISHENMSGSITPHSYSSALRAGASANYLLINDVRRPTERELLRIQGFPESFKIVVSYGKIKKQTGNSVAVPVIKAVAREMLSALKKFSEKGGQADLKSTEFERLQISSTYGC